jgi:predicted permease
MLLAVTLMRGLLAMAPADIPLLSDVQLEPRVLAFAAGITLLSALLFGVAPALRLARADLQTTLRTANDHAGGARHAGLRSILLVGEVALSLVLLVGAGLLLRSAQRLRAVDYGYRAHGLLAVSLDLPHIRYDSLSRQQQLYEQLIERVRALPGVSSVAATTEPPASGNNMTFGFVIEGRPAANPRGREDPQQLRVVTPGYFQTMGQPVLSGRAFDVTDRATTTAVVIINQALARRHWPNDDPVGQRISLVGPDGPWMQIAGVVGDTRLESVDAPPPPALYMPYAQRRPMWSWMTWASLMVRARPGVEPMSLLPSIRAALWALDARLPIHGAMAVEDAYGQTLARRRFATTLLGVFAGRGRARGVFGWDGGLAG